MLVNSTQIYPLNNYTAINKTQSQHVWGGIMISLALNDGDGIINRG